VYPLPSRLCEFVVENLFGLYSHRIPLQTNERITAIIGPNGRGKTVCLKLIEALFARNYHYFLQTVFSKAVFTFTNGETVTVEHFIVPDEKKTKNTSGELDVEEEEEEDEDEAEAESVVEAEQQSAVQKRRSLTITFTAAGTDPVSWKPFDIDGRRHRLPRRIGPFLYQVGPRLFQDDRTGERLTVEQLVRRYPDAPLIARLGAQGKPEPDGFKALVSSIPCHLIETQRLLVLPDEDDARWVASPHHPGARRVQSQSKLVVQQKAQKLQSIIQSALTQYANLSQSRDRSFPRRVIAAPAGPSLTEGELRRKLEELDQKRRALMTAGILDTDIESVTLAGRAIEGAVAKVLEIYAQDNEEKLTVFDKLLAKIRVFLDLVNARFLDKHLQIDRKSGFKVITSADVEVPLSRLSSGEQHQLVIVFDLLFDVEENSLILIDEPELSMHVLWQKTFIEGLQRMISLNPFDVILATHSPVLIARHNEMIVELGDVDE
jgi:predicted ATP-binding protein involved in virulence